MESMFIYSSKMPYDQLKSYDISVPSV